MIALWSGRQQLVPCGPIGVADQGDREIRRHCPTCHGRAGRRRASDISRTMVPSSGNRTARLSPR